VIAVDSAPSGNKTKNRINRALIVLVCPFTRVLRKELSAAGYGIYRDQLSGRCAGRGGTERKISVALLEIENLIGPGGSRCRRRKYEERRKANALLNFDFLVSRIAQPISLIG
jgi:hypothetical protein